MKFVLKMVVDHQDIGEAMVGLLNVPNSDFRCYPVADDPKHLFEPDEIGPAPSPARKTPGALPGPGTGAEVAIEAVRAGNRNFKPIADLIAAAGFSRSGTGSLLKKLVDRGLLVHAEGGYWLPDEKPEAVQKGRQIKKRGHHRRVGKGPNGEQFVIDLLVTGPKTPNAIKDSMQAGGWAPKSMDARLSQLRKKGIVMKLDDGHWMLTPQFFGSMIKPEAQPQPELPLSVVLQSPEAAE